MEENRFGLGYDSEGTLIRRATMAETFLFGSVWRCECYDRAGKLKWETDWSHNKVTDQGINALINIMLHDATKISTWYVAIFETNTTCVAGMTYAVPVYTECTAYDEATRPAFVEIESTAKTTNNNASRATYTMNDTKTIYGSALVGGGTDPTVKGNTAGGGTLFCASLFSSGSKACVATDVLKVSGVITGASST
jgi:hypothetical protein